MTGERGEVRILAVGGLPEVGATMRLGPMIASAVELRDGDIVVISQKIVSKAEGRVRDLRAVEPGSRARELAARVERAPALVQLILDESRSIVRAEPGVLITETRQGWVCANAGIDASNVPGTDTVALLPEDGDASARRIRLEIAESASVSVAIVIADSFGRPWRLGQAEVAIGCAGLEPVRDLRGSADRQGTELTATVIAIADQLAGAADLVRDKAGGVPAVVIRGMDQLVTGLDGPGAAAIRRPATDDLFR